MVFEQTKLAGATVIELEKLEDKRGFFARTWCQREFEAHGLNPRLVQCNISYNKGKGTLRGMHFQAAPYQEAKLVRCTMGAVYDVIIDLRPESPTFMRHFGITLTPQARNMLYIPEGFAHGFLTLIDDTEVFYQMSEFYAPDYGRGVRWKTARVLVWRNSRRRRGRRHLQFSFHAGDRFMDRRKAGRHPRASRAGPFTLHQEAGKPRCLGGQGPEAEALFRERIRRRLERNLHQLHGFR